MTYKMDLWYEQETAQILDDLMRDPDDDEDLYNDKWYIDDSSEDSSFDAYQPPEA